MSKRYTVGSQEVSRLRNEVERFLSFPVRLPDDFERLSEIIRESVGEYVSSTTMKRVWGYVRDIGTDYRPSVFSLRVLCNLLGFKDMEEFVAADATIQSKEYAGTFLDSLSLSADSLIELTWSPNRLVVLKHIGSTLFEVVVSENSRLRIGDKVECWGFTLNAPAYFNRVFRTGVEPFTYIAGSASGIRFRVLGDK